MASYSSLRDPSPQIDQKLVPSVLTLSSYCTIMENPFSLVQERPTGHDVETTLIQC